MERICTACKSNCLDEERTACVHILDGSKRAEMLHCENGKVMHALCRACAISELSSLETLAFGCQEFHDDLFPPICRNCFGKLNIRDMPYGDSWMRLGDDAPDIDAAFPYSEPGALRRGDGCWGCRDAAPDDEEPL